MNERIPPHDLDAEASVVGSILLDDRALSEVAHFLAPADFYRENNGVIYKAAIDLQRRGEPIDNVTLATQLSKDGLLDRIGGRSQLASMQSAVPTARNVSYYAAIVKAKARLRAVIRAGQEAVDAAFDHAADPYVVLQQAQHAILAAARDDRESRFQSAEEILSETMARWDAIEKGEEVQGLRTGFLTLDSWLDGLSAGDLITIAGRPGMGKTSLCLNVALHAALTGTGVAVFSLEMTKLQLMERLMGQHARIDTKKLRKPALLSDLEHERYSEAMGPIAAAPLYIDDDPVLDEINLILKSRRICASHPIGLIVVDYLQRMRGLDVHKGNRRLEVAGLSSALKDVARQMNVPVIVASQLTRAPEKRPDNKPILSDLSESGQIEADSDVVLLLYRPEYYSSGKKPGRAEVIVAKQRKGPTGVVELGFNAALTKFYESNPVEGER